MTNITHVTFDSKSIGCIIQAYEAALESLRGSIFASTRREKETRATLVQSIVEMAERGERDSMKLRDAALRSLGMG
jgi:hypothetical protein